jgi:multidrug efflux pump subunit AcrA (membrane-fusion protein)
MFRRRRPGREIEFSFDSFLDLVANVVGIILRLILVAWVGARSYKAILPTPPPSLPKLAAPTPLPEPTDPRLARLQARRRSLALQADEAESKTDQSRQQVLARQQAMKKELAELSVKEKELRQAQSALMKKTATGLAKVQTESMSLADLEKRSKKLLGELEALKKAPPLTKKLRYNTPVSAPVVEEVMFECQRGRVTLLDQSALVEIAKRDAKGKIDQLRIQWEVRDVTTSVGAFRLRYVLERERTALDGVGGGGPVTDGFRAGLTAWVAEPVIDDRGETVEQAMKPGSAFRRVIDALDPQQTAVTLWVYPDSFAMYRQLRDWLHGRDVVVAGRPLPNAVPIASSRRGTKSRGQ